MKRFYKSAEAGTAPDGYMVRLDGKNIKTPLLHPFLLPNRALAEAIAAEWNAQKDEVVPATMPLTQLANTMIDKAAGHERPDMAKDLERYAGSDLVCYFGTHPASLVQLQESRWLPLVEWLQAEKGIELATVSGIQYTQQNPEAVAKIRQWVDNLSPAEFTIVQAVTAATGSVVIALALLSGRITAEEAYLAAAVDEIYQLDTWGADELAQRKLDQLRRDLQDAERFMQLVAG